MSKHETWRTRKYWSQIGGLLIEEFVAVEGNRFQGKRLIDGLIILNEETRIFKGNTFDIKNKDVIILQTKANRLGMYLLGQAYFSKLLIQRFQPNSIKSVAICGKNDKIMKELAIEHNIEVVVIPDADLISLI